MFKKISLFAIFALVSICGQAQESSSTKIGVSAGYLNQEWDIDSRDFDLSGNSSGYYAGLFADFDLGSSFRLQTSALYAKTDELDQILVPVMAKYYLGNSGFNIQAGPQVNFSIDDLGVPDRFGLALAGGLGYDINDNFRLEARYAREILNRVDADSQETRITGITGYKFHNLSLGLSYVF